MSTFPEPSGKFRQAKQKTESFDTEYSMNGKRAYIDLEKERFCLSILVMGNFDRCGCLGLSLMPVERSDMKSVELLGSKLAEMFTSAGVSFMIISECSA